MRATSQVGLAFDFNTDCQLSASICQQCNPHCSSSLNCSWGCCQQPVLPAGKGHSNSVILFPYHLHLWNWMVRNIYHRRFRLSQSHEKKAWLSDHVISIYRMKALWKSVYFQARFPLHDFGDILSLFTEDLSFRKWFHNSQGEQQHHASVWAEMDQRGFV